MKAGRLRHKLEIQEVAITRGDFGGEDIMDWTTKTNGNVRGSIKYLSGKEGFTNDTFFGKNIVEFKIRFLADVSIKDRIVYDGRNFTIIPPIKRPNDVNRELLITAEEETE